MRPLTVFALVTLTAYPAAADVREGDIAPPATSVDEKMRPIDMADFMDGAPLVFLYGSAT